MKIHLLVALLALTVSPIRTVIAQGCSGPDSVSTDMIAEVNSLMTASGDTMRAALKVPLTVPSQIVLVTDPIVCARAWQAVDSTVRATNPSAPVTGMPRPLYVVRAGAYFAIVDPLAQVGEWFPMYFFGSAWKYVSMVVGWL